MIEDGLFAALKDDSAIAAKVGYALSDDEVPVPAKFHIYPLRLPAGATPKYAITYTEINQANTYPLVKQSLFQISAFGDTFDKARALAADIEAALNDLVALNLGGKFPVVYVKVENRHDLYDADAALYYFVLEVSIKY
jgi:hypothetical protein